MAWCIESSFEAAAVTLATQPIGSQPQADGVRLLSDERALQRWTAYWTKRFEGLLRHRRARSSESA